MRDFTMDESFVSTYGDFGYRDFANNLYKQYYRGNKNIVFDSNLSRVNQDKIKKVGDFETTIVFNNYPFSYSSEKRIIGMNEKDSMIVNVLQTYNAYVNNSFFKDLVKNERKFWNFNTFVRIDQEQLDFNNSNKSLQNTSIRFSLYEIPELEYLNEIKSICKDFFYRFIEIDWCDYNAYGGRGDYMPFGWNLTYSKVLNVENYVIDYLNSIKEDYIPFHYWAMLNGYVTDISASENKDRKTITFNQALTLDEIIEKSWFDLT